MSEARFVREYRLTKNVARWLCNELRRKLQRRRVGPHVLTVELQVLVALRFYAAGGFQGTVASDENIAIRQCSVSRVLVDVTEAIIDCLGPAWVKFPQTDQEKAAAKRKFYLQCGFSGVIGSVHDSFVWRASLLREEFVAGKLIKADECLLGDSGYPLEPWLLTPVAGNPAGAEATFNRKHRSNRSILERCIGMLKNRLKCLQSCGDSRRDFLRLRFFAGNNYWSEKMFQWIINEVANASPTGLVLGLSYWALKWSACLCVSFVLLLVCFLSLARRKQLESLKQLEHVAGKREVLPFLNLYILFKACSQPDNPAGFGPLVFNVFFGFYVCFQKYGMHQEYVGITPTVTIYRADLVEEVLRSNKVITKGLNYKFLRSWLGTGLVTSCGGSRRDFLRLRSFAGNNYWSEKMFQWIINEVANASPTGLVLGLSYWALKWSACLCVSFVLLLVCFLSLARRKQLESLKQLEHVAGKREVLPFLNLYILFKACSQPDNPAGFGPLVFNVFFGFYVCFQKYGMHQEYVGITPTVTIYRADLVEEVLRSNKVITKGLNYKFLRSWLGTGLVTSTGDKWRSRRRLFTPAFHFRILEDFTSTINNQSTILASVLGKTSLEQNGVDVVPKVTLCTLDIICETIMGKTLNAQSNEDSVYVKAVHRLSELFMERMATPLARSESLYRMTAKGKEYTHWLNKLHTFTREVVAERKKDMKATLNSGFLLDDEEDNGCNYMKRKRPFLDTLLLEHFKDPKNITEEDMREEVDTFMLAASCWSIFLCSC
ncbi:cytochrome P450 4c3 [Ixodes scapularis]